MILCTININVLYIICKVEENKGSTCLIMQIMFLLTYYEI